MLLALLAVLAFLTVLLVMVLLLLLSMRRERRRMITGKIILNGGRSVNKEVIRANMGNGILKENAGNIATVLNQQKKEGGYGHQIILTDCESARVWQAGFSTEIYIGSSPEYGAVSLTIPESCISRIHCRIYCYGEKYAVEDCGSTNHTWLNGFLLDKPAFLHTDDCLQLGNRRYRVNIME